MFWLHQNDSIILTFDENELKFRLNECDSLRFTRLFINFYSKWLYKLDWTEWENISRPDKFIRENLELWEVIFLFHS